MTDEQRAELKRLAEAATPGPWVPILTGDGTQGWVGTGPAQFLKQDYEGEYDANDARFIAAANPAAVLDLLREHEEDQGVIRVWRGRTERAETERDALKAENERLRAALTTIAAWDRSTFPRVPDRDDPAKTWSYGVAYGSNGERDFMRNIAAEALEGK